MTSLIAGFLSAVGSAVAAPITPSLPANKVLFSLSVGTQISYEGGESELESWGPSGLVVAGDSTVWIIDGAGRRLLGFSMSGKPVGVLDLSASVIGIGGLAAFGSNLVVLDASAQKPRILVVDPSARKVVSQIELPESAGLDRGLSGVGVETDGTIYARLEGGIANVRVGRILGSAKAPQAITAQRATEASLAIGAVRLNPQSDWRKPTDIQVNGHTISIASSNREITARLAGATASRLYVEATETSQDAATGKLLVDSTMRVFDSQGAAIGVTRIPKGAAISGSSTAIAPDGRILALVADAEVVSVVELGLVAPGQLAETLPELPPADRVGAVMARPAVASSEPGVIAAATACVPRSTMASRDSAYRSNSHYLSATNITGSCSGRTKPRYLGSAGTYSSVSYKWGGFDSVSTFNARMSPGTGRAGDITTGATLSCANGVDCAGFVSRVWGLSSHNNTSEIPGIASVIPESWLLPYDVLNKSGHVMMYRARASGGYYVSEATTKDSRDRVVYQFQPASYAAGFTPRRYYNTCCDGSPQDPCA